jgi:hypothetical protein
LADDIKTTDGLRVVPQADPPPRIDQAVRVTELARPFIALRPDQCCGSAVCQAIVEPLAADPAGQADQQQLPWVMDQTHRGIVTASGSFTTDQIDTIVTQTSTFC